MAADLVIVMSRLPLFHGVDVDALKALAERGRLRRFAVGQLVYKEGQRSDGGALLVLGGDFDVSVKRGSQQTILGRCRAGEVLGEVGMLAPGSKRSTTVTTRTPAMCLALDMDLLQDLPANPAIVALERHMLEGLSERIRRTTVAVRSVRDAPAEAAGGRSLRERLGGLLGGRS